MLTKIGTWLDQRYFKSKSAEQLIEETIAERLQKAHDDEANARHVIKTHRFQVFMARAEINALKQWDDLQLAERKEGE